MATLCEHGDKHFLVQLAILACKFLSSVDKVRPRLHGTGRIWKRAEIRPFSRNRKNLRRLPNRSNSRVNRPAKKDEFQPAVPNSSGTV